MKNLFEKADQLSGVDATFLFMESMQTPMHVGGLAIYDPSTTASQKIKLDDILSFVSERLHLAKPFRKKLSHVPLGADFPYWVDDADFDIRKHIRHYTLPKPGTWKQLCDLAASLFAQPLDLDGPLWEFCYIDGINKVDGVPKGSFAILSKAHHCAIDGASGVDIATATHTLTPNPEPVSEPPYRPEPEPNIVSKLMRAQLNGIQQPIAATRSYAKLLPGVARSAKEVLTSPNWRPSILLPTTKFNKNISNQRVFGGSAFSIADAKVIRQQVGEVTLNDVALAVVGGALRAYLEPINDLPKRPLMAMAPVAIKSKSRSATDTGNHVANMSVALATNISDPIARLKHIHQSASAGKKLMASIGAEHIANANKSTPALLASMSIRLYTQSGVNRLTRPNVNTMVTNVPGPNIPLYFCGSQLVKQFNMSPLHHGLGLVHTVFSYCGEMTIGFNACANMLPDPERYEQCLDESFESLYAAASELK